MMFLRGIFLDMALSAEWLKNAKPSFEVDFNNISNFKLLSNYVLKS